MVTKIKTFFKENILPIILVLLGVANESSNLLVQFLTDINAPAWTGSLLKITLLTLAAFKLYYTIPKSKQTPQ